MSVPWAPVPPSWLPGRCQAVGCPGAAPGSGWHEWVCGTLAPTSRPSSPRPHDFSADGFNDWAFMTTHSWDEDPSGEWVLEIENTSDANNYGRAGPASPPPPLPPSEPEVGVGAEWVPGVPPAPLSGGASDTSDALQRPGWGEAGAGYAGRGCSCSGVAGAWGSRCPPCQLAWPPPAPWAALCRGMVPCRALF